MTKPRLAAAPRRSSPPSSRTTAPRAGLRKAVVLGLDGDDAVLVRLHRAATEEVLRAELALPGYAARAGDTVLVDDGEGGWFVLGVLGEARRRDSAALTPGLVATTHDGGVELRVAAGDLTLIAAGRVVVRAGTEVETSAATVRTSATLLCESVGRRELAAERVVERVTDLYTEVSGLVQTSAGRLRTMVAGDHDLHAQRTRITSEDDTLIDGKRVLLG
mgnify:CR=1 FL=1